MSAAPRVYGDDELAREADRMAREFALEREREEAELARYYHERFTEAFEQAAEVMGRTGDLARLAEEGRGLLADGLLPVLRSMDRPTVSEDDFKTLSDTGTAAPSRLAQEGASRAALAYLGRNLNADLFPWLEGGREASDEQRRAACTAVAALVADQRTKTLMRGAASREQEAAVRDALVGRCGMTVVDGADFDLLADGPGRGEVFARETKVAGTKADVVLGLYDGRVMCLECKGSNTAVNSFKRLNPEVLDKVAKWTGAFGRQCVPGAVLKGCFSAANLAAAQREGAYLFWSSSLGPLTEFVNATRGGRA